MQEGIVETPQILKSLPTTGINASPNLWKEEKSIRDTQLAGEDHNHYWIVQGKLYDLQKFVPQHPGGKTWLQNTRGHDVTQLFITHHLNEKYARQVLQKYYVKDCIRKIQRFTFHKNGIYRTVKNRVLQKFSIQQIQRQTQSIKQTWIILALFFTFLILSALYQSYIYSTICGVLLVGVFGVMHNFIHHKQGWYGNIVKLSGFSFDQFQIMHCISHHVYVNTELDFEVTGLEPIAYWLKSKPKNKIYSQFLIQPLLMFASPLNVIMNFLGFPRGNKPDFQYIYPLLLIPFIYMFNQNLWSSCLLWFYMYSFYSFMFFKVLLCEHRMPELWTEGNQKIWDFGQHTICSTCDVNPSVTGVASFVLLAGFNLHAIHHFFPTADHSILPKLNQILKQVCIQKKVKYNSMGRIQCALKFTKGMLQRPKFVKGQN